MIRRPGAATQASRRQKVLADGFTVCSTDDQTRDINPGEPDRTTSLEAKHTQPESSAGSIGVFVLHEKRRDHFKKAYRSRTENIRRCEVRRRAVKIADRSPHNPRDASNRMVQPETGHSLLVSNRSRVHRGLRGSKGRCMGEIVPQGTQHRHSTSSNHGQRRSVQPGTNDWLPKTEQAHRPPLPLPTAGTTKWELTDDNNPREGESGRHLYQDTINECSAGMEKEMVEELERRWGGGVEGLEEPLYYETWLAGYILSGMLE